MNWLFDLYRTNPTAQAIALISFACMAGMVLGGVKVRGVGLGTSGVLFAGVLLGAFARPADHVVLEFLKEFGLVLFVFCIGLQLGPGFFASLRRVGVRLNLLATAVVALGAVLAIVLGRMLRIDSAAVLGVFSGASTNTPSLGAAQQTLSGIPGISDEAGALPALAYAVTYPTAIVGIIVTMLLLRTVLRIDPAKEVEAFAIEQHLTVKPLERRCFIVGNAGVEGLTIEAAPGLAQTNVVISRIRRRGEDHVRTAAGGTILHQGDLILAVGSVESLDRCGQIIGPASAENLLAAPGVAAHRRVVVTKKAVLGKTVGELGLDHQFGVTVTRVTRADLEMTAIPNLRLQFGDVLHAVGDEENVGKAAAFLGNSIKALNQTQFIPLFAGIVLGIALGTLPLRFPGLPQPLRLGLAGGPLIIALLVGRISRIGPLVWHMPLNANVAFREFGISLFFASVGLLSGPRFFSTVFSERGLLWLAAGACVTILPIFVVGVFSLTVLKMNFVSVCGLLAGSMTDPPALAFANNICGSEAPSVAYATVYPLTTMLRILTAQILVAVLCG